MKLSLDRIKRIVLEEKDIDALCDFISTIKPCETGVKRLFCPELRELLDVVGYGKFVTEFIHAAWMGLDGTATLRYRINYCNEVDRKEIDGGDLISTSKRVAQFFDSSGTLFELEITEDDHIVLVGSFINVKHSWYRKDGTKITQLEYFRWSGYRDGVLFGYNERTDASYAYYGASGILEPIRDHREHYSRAPETSISYKKCVLSVVNDTRWGRNETRILPPTCKLDYDLATTPSQDASVYSFVGSAKTITGYNQSNFNIGGRYFCFLYYGVLKVVDAKNETVRSVSCEGFRGGFFIDTVGRVYAKQEEEEKLFNVENKLDVIYWPKYISRCCYVSLSRKYVYTFKHSNSLLVHRRSNLHYIKTLVIDAPLLQHFVCYGEKHIRVGLMFFDINSNEKQRLATIANVFGLNFLSVVGKYLML